jgi:hypothetical protein
MRFIAVVVYNFRAKREVPESSFKIHDLQSRMYRFYEEAEDRLLCIAHDENANLLLSRY